MRYTLEQRYACPEQPASLGQPVTLPDPERHPLHSFPGQIADYTCVSTGSLSKVETAELQPSDILVRVYNNTNDQTLTVTIMYWEPMEKQPGVKIPGPHPPDRCYPASGWIRHQGFDDEMVLRGLPVAIRLFTRDERKRLVVYSPPGLWERKHVRFLAILAKRLKAMLETPSVPERGVRARYLLRIEADADRQSPDAAKQHALSFAEAVIPMLPEYGIRIAPEE
jgi:hypothetical protein